MPECRKCGRVQPRAEVRQTKLGFVCLEGGELGKFSRCWKLARERRKRARDAEREARRSSTGERCAA